MLASMAASTAVVTSTCLSLVLVLLCSLAPSGEARPASRPSHRSHSKVLIIGAGAAGYAAAARLMENNFFDLTVLEAENRVGGRIHTVRFAENIVDLGAEWVHGEAGNVLYEMAEPLELLGHKQSRPDTNMQFVWSGGAVPDADQVKFLYNLADSVASEIQDEAAESTATASLGELFLDRFGQRILRSDQRPPADLVDRFLSWYEKVMAFGDGVSWFNVSTRGNYEELGGEEALPWKRNGMRMALDLLTKRYPHPSQELPVRQRVLLKSEVSAIRWGERVYGAAGPPPEEEEPEEKVTTELPVSRRKDVTTEPPVSRPKDVTTEPPVSRPKDVTTEHNFIHFEDITTQLSGELIKDATTPRSDELIKDVTTPRSDEQIKDVTTERGPIQSEDVTTESSSNHSEYVTSEISTIQASTATTEHNAIPRKDLSTEDGIAEESSTVPSAVQDEVTTDSGTTEMYYETTEFGETNNEEVTTQFGVVQADASAPQSEYLQDDDPQADDPRAHDHQTAMAPIVVELSNGVRYTADIVIVTVSLGVLKHSAATLFDPPLPRRKRKAIQNLGFGQVDKLFMYFADPWWPSGLSGFSLLVTEEDLDAFKRKYPQYGDHSHWVHGLSGFYIDQHKPNVVLMDWIVGEPARVMEHYSDYQIMLGCKHWLDMFLGRNFSIPLPVGFTRSKWWSNPHFRGSYSYRSMDSDRTRVWPSHLAEPIVDADGVPAILFAGEATNERHYSTVHGAIESGWREADRIIRTLQLEGRLGAHRRP